MLPTDITENVGGGKNRVGSQPFLGFAEKTVNCGNAALIVGFLRKAQIRVCRETDIIELDFIKTKLRRLFSHGQVIFLHLRVEGVAPTELFPILPDFTILGLHGEFRSVFCEQIVFKDHHPGNRIDPLGL